MNEILRVGFDIESFSRFDLKKGGGHNYSLDPSTELLCFAPSINGVCLPLWKPGDELPAEWLAAMYNPAYKVQAYNWMFEYKIWHNVMVPALGLQPIPWERWDCVQARGRCFGMPQNLVGATEAFGIPMGKERNYLSVCMPRKPSKLNPDTRWTYETKPEGFESLYRQCILDEYGEASLDLTLPPWPASEEQIFQLDKKINVRGLPIDLDLCNAAIDIIGQLQAKYWVRLEAITGGAVQTHGQDKKIKEWFATRGVACSSIAKDVVDTMLEDTTLPADVREVLLIRQTMGLESIKKYFTFAASADPVTGRMYDQFKYYGAQATGRWAAQGGQWHNSPRGFFQIPKPPEGISKDAFYDIFVDAVIVAVKQRSLPLLEILYPNPVEMLSSLIRPTLTAPVGKELCVADYSNIEGRVLLWLADDPGLEIFRAGRDIYIEVAAGIYNTTYEQLLHDYKNDINGGVIKRQMGKQAVLGLGFQMGAKTFVRTVNGYNIVWDHLAQEWLALEPGQVKAYKESQADLYEGILDENNVQISPVELAEANEEAAGKIIVDAYRGKFAEVPKFWRMLEQAAIECVRTGVPQAVGSKLQFHMTPCLRWLHCILPSGRSIYWFQPRLEMKRVPWCENDEEPEYKEMLTFMKWVKGQYRRDKTYGGDLAESVTQGTARDILANGMQVAEFNNYPIVIHVHDEAGAEMDEGTSDLEFFCACLCSRQDWMGDLPLVAEGWVGKHFRKG